jgi:hypothetical protein
MMILLLIRQIQENLKWNQIIITVTMKIMATVIITLPCSTVLMVIIHLMDGDLAWVTEWVIMIRSTIIHGIITPGTITIIHMVMVTVITIKDIIMDGTGQITMAIIEVGIHKIRVQVPLVKIQEEPLEV